VSVPTLSDLWAREHMSGTAEQRAVDVLVILDGASEPLREAQTSLERARTPVLDSLADEGVITALRTVARGLPVGSETAIPGLLGWVPDAAVDRGAIEAAAHGIEVADGERAWRVDRRDRRDATVTARQLARTLAKSVPARRGASRGRVHHLCGHRMLVVGADSRRTLGGELLQVALRSGRFGHELQVWPAGAVPPRVLDDETVVIGARGAAIGIARLMGARTIVPRGATGRPGTDLAAKAAAALLAMESGPHSEGDGTGRRGETDTRGKRAPTRVVVHVGAPDEAAHERDADAKVAAIEAADALLLGPLARALRANGGTLQVCPDHGCDPATGEHDGAPVPCLLWSATDALDADRATGQRLTERTAAKRSRGGAASVADAASLLGDAAVAA
jgi:2,3-bisphosphoglycerate-independent phosphoglycerate mutase